MSKNTIYSDEKLNEVFYEIYPEKREENKSLTEPQLEITRTILSGKDSLNILPTGSGKSACYFVAAKMLPGLTIVVTPLTSLMRDQTEKIRETMGVACISGEFLHDEEGFHDYKSTVSANENDENESMKKIRNNIFYEAVKDNKYKIIFVTPERLSKGQFRRFAQRVDISLLAVDEAHCVSLWGHEFRKAYLEIPKFLKSIGKRPIIAAFTATATPFVKEEIVKYLSMEKTVYYPKEKKGLTRRENLTFSVKGVETVEEKTELVNLNKELIDELKKPICERKSAKEKINELIEIEKKYRLEKIKEFCRNNQAGKDGFVTMIYCPTTYLVNLYYESFIEDEELSSIVTRYYTKDFEKRTGEDKKKNWDYFKSNEKKIMIATNALGMGVDKNNVKYVFHVGMPSCIENYYQEAGRAGRGREEERLESECVLYYLPTDRVICNELLYQSISDSELNSEWKKFRRAIAYFRLNKMEDYCKEFENKEGSDSQQDHILVYFNTEIELEEYGNDKKQYLEASVLKEISNPNVLYSNRTAIAQEIRKGYMSGEIGYLRRRNNKINEWVGRIRDYRASGLKIDDYCEQHDISRKKFTYWLNRVNEVYEWIGRIRDCRASGLKIDDYCEQHDISRENYFYWLRRINEPALSQEGSVEMPFLKEDNKTISYKITCEPEENKINYFDMMVADAVYSLLVNGEVIIYARNIMEMLSGDNDIMPSPDQIQQINDSVSKMIKTHICIDMTNYKKDKMGFFYPDQSPVIEGNFLPLKEEKRGFSYDGQKKMPLYEAAEIMNGQFHSFQFSLLNVKIKKAKSRNRLTKSFCNIAMINYIFRRIANGQLHSFWFSLLKTMLSKKIKEEDDSHKDMPKSFCNMAMTHYMLRRIDSMSKPRKYRRSCSSSTIKLETMYSVLNEFFKIERFIDNSSTYGRKIREIDKKVEQILKHFKNEEYIVDFEQATKWRTQYYALADLYEEDVERLAASTLRLMEFIENSDECEDISLDDGTRDLNKKRDFNESEDNNAYDGFNQDDIDDRPYKTVRFTIPPEERRREDTGEPIEGSIRIIRYKYND